MIENAFTVVADTEGCAHCKAGARWTVQGPDWIAIGQSFEREEDADDVADLMNQGYAAGYKAGAADAGAEQCAECGTILGTCATCGFGWCFECNCEGSGRASSSDGPTEGFCGCDPRINP